MSYNCHIILSILWHHTSSNQSARSLLGNPFIDMFRDLSPFWLHPNDISQRICTTNVVVMNTVGAAESQNTLPTNFIFASRLYKTIQQSMVEMYQWYTTYSMYYIVTSPPQKKKIRCVYPMTLPKHPPTPPTLYFFSPKGRVSSEFKFTMAAASGPCSGTRALAMLRDIFLGGKERKGGGLLRARYAMRR